MIGQVLQVEPNGKTETINLTEMPELGFWQSRVKGFIEMVPGFDSVILDGKRLGCVAMCNEEGKLQGLPPNFPATFLWQRALGYMPSDTLVGTVLVIMGDKEFMQKL